MTEQLGTVVVLTVMQRIVQTKYSARGKFPHRNNHCGIKFFDCLIKTRQALLVLDLFGITPTKQNTRNKIILMRVVVLEVGSLKNTLIGVGKSTPILPLNLVGSSKNHQNPRFALSFGLEWVRLNSTGHAPLNQRNIAQGALNLFLIKEHIPLLVSPKRHNPYRRS